MTKSHRRNSVSVIAMRPANTGRKKDIPAAWVSVIDEFLTHQRAAGRPPSTCTTRRYHLARLARGLSCDPEQVTLTVLETFYGNQPEWKPEYRRAHRSTTSLFFAWAHNTGRLSHNPAFDLPPVKAAVPHPNPVPDRVYAKSQDDADPRVRTMMRLAAEVGMRRSEIAVCSTTDLLESIGGWQLVIHGKGNKIRVVPITDSIADMIAAGAAGHTPGDLSTGYLFPGDDGGHLSPAYVGKLCSHAIDGEWTLHKLRHRFATRAYRNSGGNLRAVQILLGHTSMATTQRYLAIDDDEVRAAMMAAA